MDLVLLQDLHDLWVLGLVERSEYVLRIHVTHLFLFLYMLYHSNVVYCSQVLLSLVFKLLMLTVPSIM